MTFIEPGLSLSVARIYTLINLMCMSSTFFDNQVLESQLIVQEDKTLLDMVFLSGHREGRRLPQAGSACFGLLGKGHGIKKGVRKNRKKEEYYYAKVA